MSCPTWNVRLSSRDHHNKPWPHTTLCQAQAKFPHSCRRTRHVENNQSTPTLQVEAMHSIMLHYESHVTSYRVQHILFLIPNELHDISQVRHGPWLHLTQRRVLWFTLPQMPGYVQVNHFPSQTLHLTPCRVQCLSH